MQTRYDVIVIGGGLIGVACALQASSQSQRVLLVERRPALGWESTWAGQLDFVPGDSELAKHIAAMTRDVGGWRDGVIDAPILEMALDRMVQAANVSLLLYAYPVRLIAEDDHAYGVVLGSKSGEQVVEASVIVDATEEALLWRQTDAPMTERVATPAQQTLFFNHAEEGLQLPLDLGAGVALRPSVWPGEVRVDFELETSDPLEARAQIPSVIERVREEVPQLADALVSHIANEPFPLLPRLEPAMDGFQHPTLRNLLGAGVWVPGTDNTPHGRVALGERAGHVAAQSEGPREFPRELRAGSVFRYPETSRDVLVVGGGTGGAIAAIAAGRRRVRTTLIEASPALGGIGTGGAIHWYYFGLNGGIQDEVTERLEELTPLFAGRWEVRGFHPEAKKCVLQEMAREAGVEIQLNTVATGVLLQSGEIQTDPEPETGLALSEEAERRALRGVLAATPEGIGVFAAQVFIDSTGDGDIAAMAGAPFIIGREKDNLPHAFSQPAGVLDAEKGTLAFHNFDAGYVDPMDVADLTRARRLGIQLYWQERFTEKARKLYIAPILGLRQSRQIIGDYQLTLADAIAGRQFDDAVSFMHTHYDNHARDYQNESDEAAFWVWALGNWRKPFGCEIPYRCLLPQNLDGLLLACRALSMTFDAHAGFRMQKDIQRIGEVAGVAAALAVEQGVPPREIDREELQAILKESGILAERYRPKPAIPETRMPELPDPEILDPAQTETLTWLALRQGPEGIATLTQALEAKDPEVRFQASAALALKGSDGGAAELLRCVEERVEESTGEQRAVPRWQAAIPFLGMTRDERAVPLLQGVLRGPGASLDVLTAAARALGSIGDPTAIPVLEELLDRDDLPTERVMHGGSPGSGINRVSDDARWQLELAVAQALGQLGHSREAIRSVVEPHLSDTRAYVRRYAHRVLEELGIPRH